MGNKKQTAVEYLKENIIVSPITIDHFKHNECCFNKANQMFEEQIIEARNDGHESTYAEYGETPKCYLDGSSENYYQQTYGTDVELNDVVDEKN